MTVTPDTDTTPKGLCPSSSVRGWLGLVNGAVAQHGEQDVATSPCQRDERLVVAPIRGAGLAGDWRASFRWWWQARRATGSAQADRAPLDGRGAVREHVRARDGSG